MSPRWTPAAVTAEITSPERGAAVAKSVTLQFSLAWHVKSRFVRRDSYKRRFMADWFDPKTLDAAQAEAYRSSTDSPQIGGDYGSYAIANRGGGLSVSGVSNHWGAARLNETPDCGRFHRNRRSI